MITAEVRPLVTRESFITEAIFLASAGSVTLVAATEGDTGATPVIIIPAAKAATSVRGAMIVTTVERRVSIAPRWGSDLDTSLLLELCAPPSSWAQ